MSQCIFSYYNKVIPPEVARHQELVVAKLIEGTDTQFRQLNYAEDITPDIALDYGVQELLYNQNFDTILILDIDCIPLSRQALEYTFNQAEDNRLVGNIQRANHIKNNEHLYIGPSCMCFTRTFYDSINRPSFEFTHRGDVGEEITYRAQEYNKRIEYYTPHTYEQLPEEGKPWKLNDTLPNFGVGTTYINKFGEEMFYHMFQSIYHVHNNLFYNKCIEIINEIRKNTRSS